MEINPGTTNNTFIVECYDDSGLAVLGLLAEDIAEVFMAWGTTEISSGLVDLDSLIAEHVDWGWFEISNGRYRFDAPDAPFANPISQIEIYCEEPGIHIVAPDIQVRSDQASIIVTPVVGISPEQISKQLLTGIFDANCTFNVTLYDADDNIIDPTLLGVLTVYIEDDEKRLLQTIANADITRSSTSITFTTLRTGANKKTYSNGYWAARVTGTNFPYGHGEYVCAYAANQ